MQVYSFAGKPQSMVYAHTKSGYIYTAISDGQNKTAGSSRYQNPNIYTYIRRKLSVSSVK